MKLKPETLPAPEFVGLQWVSGGPRTLASLRGRVVLVFFFDYSSENCLRVLSYIKVWHGRYGDKGLEILGIHSPEFDFGAEPENVRRAVDELGIPFPVALDPRFATWDAYANRFWPAVYLVDQRGYLCDYYFGEGGYQELETSIQVVLREVNPRMVMPRIIEPFTEVDVDDATVRPITPNIYFGYRRGRIGNPEGFHERREARYDMPEVPRKDVFQADGDFLSLPDALVHVGEGQARLVLSYEADEVFLVVAPDPEVDTARLSIVQDGLPLTPDVAGEAVRYHDGRAYVEVGPPGQYPLVRNGSCQRHTLDIRTNSPGVRFYCVTFSPGN